ncbi:hypothetical protein PMAC_002104 [Pneumocystis sp. 'macacae']|nr:hypothetical protein PMAC_002104 [Pneumocystis sp. 'macacae']
MTMTTWAGTVLGPPHVWGRECAVLTAECVREPDLQHTAVLRGDVSGDGAGGVFCVEDQSAVCGRGDGAGGAEAGAVSGGVEEHTHTGDGVGGAAAV